MASMDNVITRQNELFGLISRAVENLNKLDSTKITRGAVKSRMSALKANWDQFRTQHKSLCKVRTSEVAKLLYFVDNLYAICEEKYIDANGVMIDMLEDLAPEKNASAPENTTSSSTGSYSRQLPRIDLPKFSGDYALWNNYRDLFTSMIMENNDLSAVEKLHYLKMSLTGEPSQLLKNVNTSGKNLTRSWKKLIARYENKRVLIDAQLSALFAACKLKPDSSSDLKRFHNDLRESIEALEALGCPVSHWDHLLVFLTVRNFDSESLKEWEKLIGSTTNSSSFAELEAFLDGRVRTLESIERKMTSQKSPSTSTTRSQVNARSYAATTADSKCALCDSNHYLLSCPKYLEKTTIQRRETVFSKNLCYNCLGHHHLKNCKNTKRCRVCRKQHYSTLHVSSNESVAVTPQISTTVSTPLTSQSVPSAVSHVPIDGQVSMSQACSHVAQSRIIQSSSVLLSTALINIVSQFGEHYQVRALLDHGSEASFISESAAQLLKLPRKSAAVPILGIGAQRSSVSKGRISLKIISRVNLAFSLKIEALVLPKLTVYLPLASIANTQWSHINGLTLADPTFATPGKIDLILGAGVCAQILENGICNGPPGTPVAQKTSLGWVLFGQLYSGPECISTDQTINRLQCTLDCELLDLLQHFWAQEEISPSHDVSLTQEESQCEEHFKTTHSRDSHGRFIVRLPFRKKASNFGDSRIPALKMLRRMELRFEIHASLKAAYQEFLREYLELDHMRIASSRDSSQREFYLPHHTVLKESSSTTKLRVVFNGSQKTNLGISLNDCLHIGPKLQTDLIDIIVRWRRHRYVFATDIEKMYRQICVNSDDWQLQKIFWRDSPCESPQKYVLCTVTYGLACAPYLALRCLQQLANDVEFTHALAAEVLCRDTYVDDILSGSDNISTTVEKMQQLMDTLKAGGFTLKKWSSNDPEVLKAIPVCDRDPSATLLVGDSSMHCVLGIRWNRKGDNFVFVAPSVQRSDVVITKRSVLSFIARIFDPLGWIAPITVTAKRFMQELWAIRLDWDDKLSESLKTRWFDFTQQFKSISDIAIPRFGTSSIALETKLHGFSDASQHAIAAVIYLRIVTPAGVHVTLVSAKTKVAPLKRITIPRLELSTAVLLMNQLPKIREALDLNQTPAYLWMDSTIALTWIPFH